MYTIFTDTDCDITPEIAARYGYKLISMPYTIEGKEVYPYVDFEKFDHKEFYDRLRKGVVPVTSALPPVAYVDYFEPEFKAGRDILYVHFSAAMSATFNSLRLALEELHEKYPDRKLHLIDTKGITLGSHNICLSIGELYRQGKSIEEIEKWADENVDHIAFYFYADDLKFFAKSGRVSGFSAFLGGIIGIKPIIFIDESGTMKTKAKARGRKGALEKLLGYVIELEDHIKDHRVIIAHTDAPEIAEEFAKMLREHFGADLKIDFEVVNPTAGSHCGPNAMGITFHAKHR
ncbi:MAG TPA: DegV family protein [Bacilli bacterium]|nr:DegV family protein [Bacilli bacterium]HPS18964.1 DegV family protein [Bacilli bacterium]